MKMSIRMKISIHILNCSYVWKCPSIWRCPSVSKYRLGRRMSEVLNIWWNDEGRGSVVRESEFKSEDPGFNPLVGQGEVQFFWPCESTVVQISLCLHDPPSCVRHAPKFVRTLKIPYPPVVKNVGLTTGGMVGGGGGGRWIAPYYGCLLSQGDFRVTVQRWL